MINMTDMVHDVFGTGQVQKEESYDYCSNCGNKIFKSCPCNGKLRTASMIYCYKGLHTHADDDCLNLGINEDLRRAVVKFKDNGE